MRRAAVLSLRNLKYRDITDVHLFLSLRNEVAEGRKGLPHQRVALGPFAAP